MFQYLTLALLVARVLADNINPPLAAYEFAGRATRLDRCLHFHMFLQSPRDTGFAPVRVELQEHLVSHKHFDAVEPHFARKISQHHLIVPQRDFEQRIRQGLFYDALNFWCLAIH